MIFNALLNNEHNRINKQIITERENNTGNSKKSFMGDSYKKDHLLGEIYSSVGFFV